MNKWKRRLSILVFFGLLHVWIPYAAAEGKDGYEVAEVEMAEQEVQADAEVESDEQKVQAETEVNLEEQTKAERLPGDSSLEICEEDEILVETEEKIPLVSSSNVNSKPSDGSVIGQPFKEGTGGSSHFSFPVMVTLNNGRIVAAADAHWTTAGNYEGCDTLVSYSDDNGATWTYTFANYLGDSGSGSVEGAPSFVGPSLVTDGSTLYMMVDLCPGGYDLEASGSSVYDNGFDSNGCLKLSNNGRASYDYYLKDGRILSYTGEVVTDYSVDAWFNITGKGVDTNLFSGDSPFLVVPTDYLYLTASGDGGASWGEPTLLPATYGNKTSYQAGPGKGIVTTSGTIVFPVYNYSETDQNPGALYSNDHGNSWNVLETVSDSSFQESIQLNALKYSQSIEGKSAFLLSISTFDLDSSGSISLTGKLLLGLQQEDGAIQYTYSYPLGGARFQYSCLTELKNGSVGILYESEDSIYFEAISLDAILSGSQFTSEKQETEEKQEEKQEEEPSKELVITEQPVSVSANLKDKISFRVNAENAAAYQWQYSKNGSSWYKSSVSGSNTDCMTITVSSTNCENQYRCKITGLDGSIQYSDPVVIQIKKDIQITSQPVSVTAKSGDKVSFIVGAENVTSYQWYYSKDGGSKWYKSTAAGATTETLSITASSSNRSNLYRCKLTGEEGKILYTNAVGMNG